MYIHIHKHNSSGLVVCPATSLRSPIIHGWKKNPLEGVKTCQSQPITQSHGHARTPHYPTLLHSICSDQLHCIATTQPSNTTSILPFLQYRSIHSAPPILALCVSIMQPFSSHSHIHSRNPVGSTKGHIAFFHSLRKINSWKRKTKIKSVIDVV